MIEQEGKNGETNNLYLSNDGASVLIDSTGNLVTTYPNKPSHKIKPQDRKFYERTKRVLKAVNEYEKSKLAKN